MHQLQSLFFFSIFLVCFKYPLYFFFFADDSIQDNTTTASSFTELPDSLLYPSLTSDLTQTTASSSDYQTPLLPLDVTNILKPSSFDMIKMEDQDGMGFFIPL